MSPSATGIIGFVVVIVLFTLRLPVAFAMALVGFLGFSYLVSLGSAFSMVAFEIHNVFSNYYYASAIMFIWMGFIAYYTGISRNLYSAVHTLVGHIRGGVAMATVGACAGFGAICGSSLATTATMGAVSLPEMKRYRYDDALATGSVATGGILGTMIPPSIPLIVYAMMTETSIGKAFIGIIFPGLLLTIMYMAMIYILTLYNPRLGPPGPKTSFKEKGGALLSGGTGETLVVFAIVLGGLFVGWFTPTEAGAIGSASILLVGLARRRLNWRSFYASLVDAVKTSAMVFLLVVGAEIFGTFMAVSRVPAVSTTWAGALPIPAFVILIIMVVFQGILGCFMDGIAAVLLSLPIVFPVLVVLGYDPIWLLTVMVFVAGLGMITPPVGLNCYIIYGIAKDVPLTTIFKGVIPFIGTGIIWLAALIAFPQIALFLPGLMK